MTESNTELNADSEPVDVAAAILNREATYKEVCGLTDEEMEAAYSAAYTFFQAGKYDDAEEIFQFLALFDSSQPKYWIGLGGCREAKKEFSRAADAYIVPTLVDTPEPQAPFRAAICCEAAGMKDEARNALAIAIEWASEDPTHALIKAQAESMLEKLQN
ncbi:MAG: SycD/LcrH family type III secretion system chaperone [Verrucomicrobiota bacterium]